MQGVISIIVLGIRILITVYCVNKAEQLNRNKTGWGIFAFFLPIIAAIAIQFVKPNIKWDSETLD